MANFHKPLWQTVTSIRDDTSLWVPGRRRHVRKGSCAQCEKSFVTTGGSGFQVEELQHAVTADVQLVCGKYGDVCTDQFLEQHESDSAKAAGYPYFWLVYFSGNMRQLLGEQCESVVEGLSSVPHEHRPVDPKSCVVWADASFQKRYRGNVDEVLQRLGV